MFTGLTVVGKLGCNIVSCTLNTTYYYLRFWYDLIVVPMQFKCNTINVSCLHDFNKIDIKKKDENLTTKVTGQFEYNMVF
jgi:hypothetical protein